MPTRYLFQAAGGFNLPGYPLRAWRGRERPPVAGGNLEGGEDS